jgi:hypothetical protein
MLAFFNKNEENDKLVTVSKDKGSIRDEKKIKNLNVSNK